MWALPFLCLICALAALGVLGAPGALAADDETVALAEGGRATCVIVVPPGREVCLYAAKHLQRHIRECGGDAPEIVEGSMLKEVPGKGAVVALGVTGGFSDLDALGLGGVAGQLKRDGFALNTVPGSDRDYVLAVGLSETGAANAVWRLMRELQVSEGRVFVSALDIVASPFIKSRDVVICSPWTRAGLRAGAMAETLKGKYRPRSWPVDRLRRLVQLLASFGYNANQFSDLWVQLDQDPSVSREEWREKLIEMTKEAHRNGLTSSLFVYGSSVADPKTGTIYARPGACFKDPYEKQVLLDEYDYQAESYAACVDHVVTHWSDFGGQPNCQKGCTIETALEQHNVILAKFRAINPDIRSSFSMWNVIPAIWPGYEDYGSVLQAGILAKEVGIAMPARLNPHLLTEIHESGHPAGVWGWRLLDIEHWHGLHVHTDVMEKYFRSFSPETEDLLEWYSVDDVSQFLAASNLYVAAQLLWDPQRSGKELVREYTRGMFGPENAEKMALVLEAVEKASCYLCPGHQPDLTKVLEGAEERRTIIQEARETLADVRMDPAFVPAFPQIISPEELLKEISAQFEAIGKYNEFHLAVIRLMEYYPELQGMGDTAAIEEAFNKLPKVPAPEEYLWVHIYGRYTTDLENLRKELGLSVP